jgi:hypothetical protein
VSRNVGRTAPVDAAIRPPQPIRSDRRHPAATARRLGVASAALLLVGGYVHLCLYGHGYRFIPKIGVGFLLEAVSSALLAVALVVRGRRIHVGRRSVSWAQLTRLAAIGLSLGTLAALGIAHTPSGLFQFREIGLRPAPQTLIAIVAESLATLLLGLAMVEGLRTTPGQIVTAPAEERPRQTGLDGRAGH